MFATASNNAQGCVVARSGAYALGELRVNFLHGKYLLKAWNIWEFHLTMMYVHRAKLGAAMQAGYGFARIK